MKKDFNGLKSVEKKGQQISMPIIGNEETPDILEGKVLEIIDIRNDWAQILDTIYNNQHIQRAMEKAYQDYQEGHKLKDFKYRKGVDGLWKFADIHHGRFPYILTTSNWLYEYEKKEWLIQAKDAEKDAMDTIEEAIYKCKKLIGYSDMIDNLEEARNKLYLLYPPRYNQPETWRPQDSANWTSKWMKILAEQHYHHLAKDWRIVSSNSHSIVVGINSEDKIYMIDLMLLTIQIQKILDRLNHPH